MVDAISLVLWLSLGSLPFLGRIPPLSPQVGLQVQEAEKVLAAYDAQQLRKGVCNRNAELWKRIESQNELRLMGVGIKSPAD
jgi:hypothetical protein